MSTPTTAPDQNLRESRKEQAAKAAAKKAPAKAPAAKPEKNNNKIYIYEATGRFGITNRRSFPTR